MVPQNNNLLVARACNVIIINQGKIIKHLLNRLCSRPYPAPVSLLPGNQCSGTFLRLWNLISNMNGPINVWEHE